LPRALAIALGKDFFGKLLNITLPRARDEALGKSFFFFAEGRPSAKKLPTAPVP